MPWELLLNMRDSCAGDVILLCNQLFRDSDWASMAHSLELRTSLVDIELIKELAPVLI